MLSRLVSDKFEQHISFIKDKDEKAGGVSAYCTRTSFFISHINS